MIKVTAVSFCQLATVAHFAATDRAVLRAVRLTGAAGSDEITSLATDSYRLARVTRTISNGPLDEDFEAVVPLREIKDIAAFIANDSEGYRLITIENRESGGLTITDEGHATFSTSPHTNAWPGLDKLDFDANGIEQSEPMGIDLTRLIDIEKIAGMSDRKVRITSLNGLRPITLTSSDRRTMVMLMPIRIS